MDKQEVELLELINQKFNVEQDGRLLLEKLKKKFFSLPVCPVNAPESFGRWREGQNDMLRYFEKSIKRLQTYKETSQKKPE